MVSSGFTCCTPAFRAAVISTILFTAILVFNFQCSSLFSWILYCAFFVSFLYHLCSRCLCGEKIQPINKAVFITGCDTGFGNELAKKLDSKGFRVFAGCLFPESQGAKELKKHCSERLQVLYLDVTKDESVEKAKEFVKENLGTAELWALVNNAGILKGLPIELTSLETFRENMEVNGIGPVRVTKAFLPLLRQSKGRVINVTSVSGRVSIMATCAYSMSKRAAVAFAECLSQEMNAWGIKVITIEPEPFRTPMLKIENLQRSFDEELKTISEEILNSYGGKYVEKLKSFLSYINHFPLSFGQAVDVMESAVTDRCPSRIYKPRWNFATRIIWNILESIPYGVFEYIQLKIIYLLGYPVPKCSKY